MDARQQTIEEQKVLLNELMLELQGKDKIMEEQTTRLFNINNNLMPELREYNRSCPACRERVYNRMLSYWTNNVLNKNEKG
jgi:hypothetical protein